MIVMAFKGKNNVSGMMVGIIVAALMMGQDLGMLANMFLIFVTIEVLLNYVTLGGGFDALSDLLGGLPMGCLAVSILAATRLTGSMYPTSNFAGQMGTAQCTNIKGALQALWFGVGFAWLFVVIYAFVGPMILG